MKIVMDTVKLMAVMIAFSWLVTGCASMGKFMQDVGQNQMAHNNPPTTAPRRMDCEVHKYGTITELECR